MNDVPSVKVNAIIDSVVREAWGQTLSALVLRIRDFQLSEDALQDAILAAWKNWTAKGVPKKPQAWLYKTALRKAIDQIRRKENFESKRGQIEILHELERDETKTRANMEIPDERLRLIFTCCHPALDRRSNVALTLRAVGGLQTREIARAFLIEEATMAQRLTRAKRKIRDAGIPYRVPPAELWPERLDSVLSVLYFIFNEGYQATSGDALTRFDLCKESIHLAQVLYRLVPEEAEVAGLLSLMMLHHARSGARVNQAGDFIPLEFQDRDQWDHDQIGEGTEILKTALQKRSLGPYQIQAAISAIHAEAANWESTDWTQIARLYGELYRHRASDVVLLNQVVALSWAEGVQPSLDQLKEIESRGTLSNYQPFYAVKADLLRRLGRSKEALPVYQQALALSDTEPQRRFLQMRIDELLEG